MNASGGPQDEPGRERSAEDRNRRFEELELVRRQLESTTERLRKMRIEPNLGLILNMAAHAVREQCEHCLSVLFGE